MAGAKMFLSLFSALVAAAGSDPEASRGSVARVRTPARDCPACERSSFKRCRRHRREDARASVRTVG
jgi:hypothetical protein